MGLMSFFKKNVVRGACGKCKGDVEFLPSVNEWKTMRCLKCGRIVEKPEEADRSLMPVPTECPNCSGLIEHVQDEWICIGLPTRAQVERVNRNANPLIESVPSCGWRGKDKDFLVRWG